MKSLSRAQLLVTPWTAAYQAPPSMGFSRQEYWSGVPLLSRHCELSGEQRHLLSWNLYSSGGNKREMSTQKKKLRVTCLMISVLMETSVACHAPPKRAFLEIHLSVFAATPRLFSSCGEQRLLYLRLMSVSVQWLFWVHTLQGAQASAVVACGLSSCGAHNLVVSRHVELLTHWITGKSQTEHQRQRN